MTDVIYKFTANDPNYYYLNVGSEKKEYFLNGIIININNINYIVTTYLPTNEISISYNDVIFDVKNSYSNLLFNLSAFEITDQNISNLNVYGHKNVCLKLNFNDKTSIKVLNENLDVDITNQLSYDLYNKYDFLPPTILIKSHVNNHEGIDSGCAVVKYYNNKSQLIGIISHLEIGVDDDYILYIIPCYTIIKFIKHMLTTNKLTNLWLDIDENNTVINIKSKHKCYSVVQIGDIINKIDTQDVINGKIHIKDINYNVPFSTYLWYNQHVKKANKFQALFNQKDIIFIDYKLVNDVLTTSFIHDKLYLTLITSECRINIQTLSYELLNYMIDRDVYIDNEITYDMFESPFGDKIPNIIITNHDVFRDVTILDALSESNDIPIKINSIKFESENKFTRIWQFNKKKNQKNNINIKLITENQIYELITHIL